MALPLSDIRVLEICQVFAGPLAGMLLADQGADVIKIEPSDGDPSRPAVSYLPEVDGMSVRYVTFNRNKRSVVLDIGKPKGREVVYDLLRRADVLLVNMRVGARQRAGLTYEQVAVANPRVIYASITGYGEEGPDADLPGYDIVTQARVGDMASRPHPNGPPPHTQLYHFDMSAAMLLVYGVMLALRQRERTGVGQKVDTSLLQAALACQTVNMTRRAGSTGNYGIVPTALATYLCSDGKYIFTMNPTRPRWERFCRTVGLNHLAEDPAYDTNEKRAQKAEALGEILSRLFATKPTAEWEAILKANGNVASVVKEISEVYDDPQVIANEMITQFEQPGLGPVTVTNVPFQMSSTAHEPHLRCHAPALGEHTVEVLLELGRTSEEVQSLKAEGVIP